MRRPEPPSWRAALAEARRGSRAPLAAALAHATELGDDERRRLLGAALAVAEAHADQQLLAGVLEQSAASGLRADALAVVLGVADELAPRFPELMAALRDGERALVLGALLEASRLDPDPERRLLRLQRLMKALPPASRGVYWPEAEALAEQGGDDAQLTLLGFVRDLPLPARSASAAALKRAVRRVRDGFKRALAFVALGELTPLGPDDLHEAEVSAARIPDTALRTMTLMRLAQFQGRDSG